MSYQPANARLLALTSILLVWLTGCSSKASRATPQPTILPVAVIPVEYQEGYHIRRTFTGEIAARQSADLGFEFAGRVAEIRVDEGDHVENGAELASLDTALLVAERCKAEAEREAGAALLQELRTGPRKEVIEAARATVEEMHALRELALRREDRLKRLRQENAISDDEYEQAFYESSATDGRLLAAKSRLEELLAGSREEQIAAREAELLSLDGSLRLLDIQIEKSRLIAPFSGQVAKRWVDRGGTVRAGDPVISLAENVALEARINITPGFLAKVKAARTSEIVVAGKGYAASIQAVLPHIDPASRTVTIIFALEGQPDLLIGQLAHLEVKQRIETRGALLPQAALVSGTRGLWSCFALEFQDHRDPKVATTVRRDLEVLHVQGDHVFVRGTLEPGELIVRHGVQRLVAGQKVRPMVEPL